MLPVTATAQQERRNADGRRSDQQRSERAEERRADRSDQRRSGRDDHQRISPANDQRLDLGLPRIGLPPPPTNRVPSWERSQLPSWEQRQTPWWERQGQPSWERSQLPVPSWTREAMDAQDHRGGKRGFSRRNQPAVIYVLPPYRYFPYDSIYSYGVSSSTTFVTPPPPNVVTMTLPAPPAPPITTGFLKLEVEPRDLLQVFVDGLFIGSLADLGDEIELRLGARRIELRAPGYRTLIFDTEIVADRTIVYRGVLEPVANAPTPPAAAPAPPVTVKPSAIAGPRTMYVIPGCYLGNVAPKASDLRSGCDISKLSKIEP